MNRKLLKYTGTLTLALSLALVGCDAVSDSLTGPSEKSDILIIQKDENGYTIATETDPTVGVVTAFIDQNGGSLNIGDHTLTVPAGAVSAPALFTMTKLPGQVKVGLTATRLLPNDVGSRGFAKPLTLSLKYDENSVPNEGDLKIFWVKLNGQLVQQPSVVDAEGNAVSASLDHFSDYGVGFPNNCPTCDDDF